MPRTLEPALRAFVPWLLAVLLAGIAAEITLAGVGLLDQPSFLGPHRRLGPWLAGLAAVVVAVALAARDRAVALWGGVILVLLLLQGPLIRSLGFLRSLHAISAVLSFAICILL